MSCKGAPAAANASPTTSPIFSRCSREASSGTTPPYFLCVAICEAMTFERTLTPSSMTAAAVSSHELSIPRVSIGPHYDICHISYEIWHMSYDGAVFLVLWIRGNILLYPEAFPSADADADAGWRLMTTTVLSSLFGSYPG